MQQPPHAIIDVDAQPTLGDSASADVDAFTAAPLHEHRHIAVTLSTTDGKQLRLWYNTKTLIIIAQRKGRWMQPPHFRTDMDDAMVREIERIEGRRIEVNSPLTRFGHANEATDGATAATGPDAAGRPSSARHIEVDNWDAVTTALHHGDVLDTTALRAVAAVDQLVDARTQEPVYVCPVCYKEALKRLEEHREARIQNEWQSLIQHLAVIAADRPLEDGQRELIMGRFELHASRARAPPCPLEVIASLDPEARVQVCFARAAAWRKHLVRDHNTKCFSSSDWTVHELVEERLADKADTTGRFARGDKRYWARDAKWRTLFYNELRRSTVAVSGPSVRSSGETSPCPEPPEGRGSTTPAVSQPRKQHRAEAVEAAAVHTSVADAVEAPVQATIDAPAAAAVEHAVEGTVANAVDCAGQAIINAADPDDAVANAAVADTVQAAVDDAVDDAASDATVDELDEPTDVELADEEDDAASSCDSDGFMSAVSHDVDELSLAIPSDPWMEYDEEVILAASRQDAASRASNTAPPTPVLVVCHCARAYRL